MIQLIDITKSYGQAEVLRQMDFTVPRGTIMGFLGANGAGKTTTMDLISGCIGPDRGQVLIDGIDMEKDPVKAKAKIGYLPDEPPLHLDMRVGEFIRYAGRLRGLKKAELKERYQEVLRQLDLTQVEERLIGNLSKGFKQRVGLAQALIHNPEVLVLDEPTEGLDPSQIAHIRELIKDLKGNHTIILSSHILSEVESICESLIIIDQGKILAQGSPESLRQGMGAPLTYLIEVKLDGEGLLKAIEEAIQPAKISNPDPQQVLVQLSHKNQLNDILRIIANGSYELQQIKPTGQSLEDVFMKLTQSESQPRKGEAHV